MSRAGSTATSSNKIKTNQRPHRPGLGVGVYFVILALIGTTVVAASLLWNLFHLESTAIEAAKIQARTAFEKDVVYRRWNTIHGGVYAPVTPETYPNPYLNVEEKDIQTPSGRPLTKINPAYMTRQVHELGALSSGVMGHITSLKPLRPQNAPDMWEALALHSLEKGQGEVSEIRTTEGQKYLRLMRPLITEQGCLQCHQEQGYKLGDIRGGISVSVPMAPIWSNIRDDRLILIVTHVSLWLIGMAVLGFAARHLRLRLLERSQAEMEKERIISELQVALAEVKTLKGFIPICSKCKKIRDDEGYWNRIESYIQEHSEAVFSHSICPDCRKELYPEITDWGKKPKE
jgi:hypothetical protein